MLDTDRYALAERLAGLLGARVWTGSPNSWTWHGPGELYVSCAVEPSEVTLRLEGLSPEQATGIVELLAPARPAAPAPGPEDAPIEKGE